MKIQNGGQILEALPSVWWAPVSFTNPLAAESEAGNLSRWAPVCPLVSDATAECQIVKVMCGVYKFFLGRRKFSGLYFAF